MKKISLKNLNLNQVEQLSREQLKDVIGGWSSFTLDLTSGTTTAEDCEISCQTSGDGCKTSSCEEGTCVYKTDMLICVTN